MTGWVMRITVLAGVVSLCLLTVGLAAPADASIRKATSIPAEPLDEALRALAKDRQFQVLYRAELVRDIRTNGAVGSLTSDEALTKVLSGTGLTYKYLDAQTVTLIPVAATVGAAATNQAQTNPPDSSQGDGKNTSQDFRMAQVDQTSAGPQVANSDQSYEKKPVSLEEVVVTGTHIRGTTPASPLTIIDRQEIEDSGFTTVGDVIRSSPLTFSGGVNPGVVGAFGSQNAQNVSAASTVNLRGLGPESTLTLIDGRRLAYDGISNSVDISAIPLAALERVEIVADGASALYGSDAVAGVTNFILRKDYSGAEVSGNVGTTSNGGATDAQASALAGTSWQGGNAMLSYEHFRQDQLLGSQRPYSNALDEPTSLLPEQHRDSVFASVQQNVTDNAGLFFEGLFTTRYANLYSTAYGTTYWQPTDVRQFGVTGGVNFKLPQQWLITIAATSAGDRDEQQNPSSTAGQLLVSPSDFYANRALDFDVSADGHAFDLPSGPVMLAVGAGYRTEHYEDNGGESGQREIRFEYAEVNVPLISPDSNRLGAERLELSASGRHENYSDFGNTTNPKVGLLYVPYRDLTLRATWGTAFRAPSLLQEYGLRFLELFPGAELSMPGTVLVEGGANSRLQPETATTWTSGMDYRPQWVDHAKLSLTYFRLNYSDRITNPVANTLLAFTGPLYAPFVVRNPSAALLQSLMDGASFYNLSGQPYDPGTVSGLIENQWQNVAQQLVDGVDVAWNQRISVGASAIDVVAAGTWLRLREELTPASSEETLTGTIFNPSKLKLRGGATWIRAGWSVGAFLNYVSPETDTYSGSSISSWTTADGQLAYQTSKSAGALSGLRVALSVLNMFNRDPPFVASASTLDPGMGYDSTNASPLGRFISLTVTKTW